MELSLSHKGDQLEFSVQATFHSFESELNWRYLFTQVAKVFILSEPLLRYIVVVHYYTYLLIKTRSGNYFLLDN